MKQTHDVSIEGKIVETMEDFHRRTTTILVNPFSLTIDAIDDAHLGDKVVLDVRILIKSVNHQFQQH